MRSPPSVAVMPEKLSKSYWDDIHDAAATIVLAKQYIRVQNSSRTPAKDIAGHSLGAESEYFPYPESYYLGFNTYRDINNNNNPAWPTVRTNRVNRTNIIQSEFSRCPPRYDETVLKTA